MIQRGDRVEVSYYVGFRPLKYALGGVQSFAAVGTAVAYVTVELDSPDHDEHGAAILFVNVKPDAVRRIGLLEELAHASKEVGHGSEAPG